MAGHKQLILAALALAGIGPPSQAREPAPLVSKAQQRAFTVLVYNFSRAPGATLDRAGREAARIFAAAGIDLTWLECPVSETDHLRRPDCQRQPGPTLLVLRVLPQRRQTSTAILGETFGIARVNRLGGVYADLFYADAETIGHGAALDFPRLLGALAAHEIGHLLLGTNAHSRGGIMRARWSKPDLLAASRGWLAFSETEAQRLRDHLRLRLEAQGTLRAGADPSIPAI